MSELEIKTEAEVEDFTDELSDEALDRGKSVHRRNRGKSDWFFCFATGGHHVRT